MGKRQDTLGESFGNVKPHTSVRELQELADLAPRLVALIALLTLWQILAMLVARPVLPPPGRVLVAFAQEAPRSLGQHFSASLLRVVSGITLAIATAAPAGLVLGQSRRVNRLAAPFIYLLYPVPKVVLVPIILLTLGVGELPKVGIIALILYFQILVLVRDAASSIRPELLMSVRSLGAGRRALFRFVYVPATLPAVLTAVRQSIGTAVAVLYIAELFATRYGLGYYIFLQGSTLFDYPRMYAGILGMSLLGFSLAAAVDALERRVCPWHTRGS
jgi:ABC-type nitrate/sulfonate/bicarbonate transport system permease component